MKSAALEKMVEHVTRPPKEPPSKKGKPWRGTLKDLAAHGRKGLRKQEAHDEQPR